MTLMDESNMAPEDGAVTSTNGGNPEPSTDTSPSAAIDGKRATKRGGGAKTAHGRDRCSKNAFKDGFRSSSPVLPGQDLKPWKRHLRAMMDSYAPQTYAEMRNVRMIALADFKMEQIDRHELAVVQNQIEEIWDSDSWDNDVPEDEQPWLHTEPARAWRILHDLPTLDDNQRLQMGEIGAILVVLRGMIEPNLLSPMARARITLLTSPRVGMNVRTLRGLLEVLAQDQQKLPEAVASQFRLRLELPAFQQLHRAQRRAGLMLRMEREAMIPNEKEQKRIERARTHWQRTKDRASADLERLQRARTGTLPPPLRMEVTEG